MHLSPQEKDKLLVVTAALLAERRLQRGLKLNHPEAVAFLSLQILEGARDGTTVAELMQVGSTWLSRDQVMDGVAELVSDCLLYTSPSPRDATLSRMPSSA